LRGQRIIALRQPFNLNGVPALVCLAHIVPYLSDADRELLGLPSIRYRLA